MSKIAFSASILKRALLLNGILLLASCTHFSHTPPGSSTSTVEQWSSSGKIAITLLQPNLNPGIKKNSTFRFDWTQSPERSIVNLRGTFGFGLITITKDAQGVELSRGKKLLGRAKTQEALLHQHTGLQLPISLLEYWITGKPSPSTASNTINDPAKEQAAIPDFEQQGWTIKYSSTSEVNGIALPARMTATNSDFLLRAIIKNWRL